MQSARSVVCLAATSRIPTIEASTYIVFTIKANNPKPAKMSILAVPESGLQLESSTKSSNFLPLQAFNIALNDSVIEDMIKCVQNGDQIELALGNNPVSGLFHNPLLPYPTVAVAIEIPAAFVSRTYSEDS